MATSRVPVLDHLYGSHRGSRQPVRSDELLVGTARRADVHFSEEAEPAVMRVHARLQRLPGGTYRLLAEGDAYVTVNGRVIQNADLHSGDLIRFGEGGPVLRYRVTTDSRIGYRRLRDVVDDCRDGARAGSGGAVGRVATMARRLPADVLTLTRPSVRLSLTALLLTVSVALVWLFLRTAQLQQDLRRTTAGVDEIAMQVDRDRSVSRGELSRLRDEIDLATERLNAMGDLEPDAVTLLQRASESVVFLQGAFGFRDAQGRLLRVVLDEDGDPLLDSRGNQLVNPAGSGPVFERQHTGTGFVVTDAGHILTNRHVAQPWDFDQEALAARAGGMSIVPLRMVAYLSGGRGPYPVGFVARANWADVALLRSSDLAGSADPLLLGRSVPGIGQSVYVLGYPVGLRGLLARAEPGIADSLITGRQEDFWRLAEGLSLAGRITPLVTRGIVGQVTPGTVVYDAQTTHGGSGGPVLARDGSVVAVNAAILPEFGGSNMGVRADSARALLERVQSEIRQ